MQIYMFSYRCFCFYCSVNTVGGLHFMPHLVASAYCLHTFQVSANEEQQNVDKSGNKYLPDFTYLIFALYTTTLFI